jgi:PAS domain S-box-containing protein
MTLEEDMVISRVNSEFSRLTGYARNEVEGVLRWTDVIESNDSQRLLSNYRLLQVGAIPSINRFEFEFITKERTNRKFLATVAIIPTTRRGIASLVESTQPGLCEEVPEKNREDLFRIPNTA